MTSSSGIYACTALVVGGGPVGLAVATALAKEGHRVTVLERHPGLQSPGSAVSIQPAASRCLTYLGAEKFLEESGLTTDNMTWWSYKENEPMAVAPYPAISSTTRYQLDRPAVQEMLHKVAIEAGAKILFNKTVVKVADDENKPKVWTQDGEEFTADLIIGADGIKSATRRLIFPNKDTEPIANQERVFVTSVPTSILKEDPRVSAFLNPLSFQLTLGPGRFTVTRSLGSDRYATMFIVMDYGAPGPVDASWNVPGDVDELRKRFDDFNEPTRAYLEHVKSTEVWQMAYGQPLESWRSGGGRFALMGDAAHAMLPYSAQGLSQGIEDAVALARMLRWGPERGVPFVLRCYEEFRRPRVERIVKSTVANGGRNTLVDGPGQQERDRRLRATHGAVSKVDWANVMPDPEALPRSPPYQKWEQDYDVVAEVDTYMSNVLAGFEVLLAKPPRAKTYTRIFQHVRQLFMKR